jgi:hypothetical protein
MHGQGLAGNVSFGIHVTLKGSTRGYVINQLHATNLDNAVAGVGI